MNTIFSTVSGDIDIGESTLFSSTVRCPMAFTAMNVGRRAGLVPNAAIDEVSLLGRDMAQVVRPRELGPAVGAAAARH